MSWHNDLCEHKKLFVTNKLVNDVCMNTTVLLLVNKNINSCANIPLHKILATMKSIEKDFSEKSGKLVRMYEQNLALHV